MSEEISNCLVETHKHVNKVRGFLNLFIQDLIERGQYHDSSKFEEPELSVFAKYTPELGKVEYGSQEYKDLLLKVKVATDHHYSRNRHHPEHWPNGIENMTLVDLIEMLSDWKAATERNKDGNIRKSISINSQKYKFPPELRTIFENTVREYFKE